jgi:hypothetical protein
MWHHVEVLAADDMEGRGIGTRGLERAEAYVVDQLQKAGIAPAGRNGYFQPIGLQRRDIVDGNCSAVLVRNGKADPLTLGEDAACTTYSYIASNVEAPLVFVGLGNKAPEIGIDDLAGLDLKGKIAVTMRGQVDGLDGPLAAHAQRERDGINCVRQAPSA